MLRKPFETLSPLLVNQRRNDVEGAQVVDREIPGRDLFGSSLGAVNVDRHQLFEFI